MKPRTFFDIEVRASASTGPGGMSALPIMARLVWVLHGIMREQPARYALAFPAMRKGEFRHIGNVVRIFASSREELDQVVEALSNNERIHGYVQYGYPRTVPEDFNGKWQQYRRFRIPGSKTRTAECRSNRLAQAEDLPYLRTSSKTTGQAFSLHVDCCEGSRSEDCEPDSYGLSVASRPFALPVMP